jgi:two-component system OmpR family response regulator
MAENAGEAPLETIRVLHIDDDPAILQIVGRRLAPLGIECQGLTDERRWQQAIADRSYHVVLLDIDLPHRDGLRVLRDIKRFDGSIPVIMLTGIVRSHIILDALRDGAEFCFFKPVEEIEPIARAILSTTRRIDHWREAVRHACAHLDRMQTQSL